MSKGSGTTRSGSSSNPKALAASGAPKSVVVGGASQVEALAAASLKAWNEGEKGGFSVYSDSSNYGKAIMAEMKQYANNPNATNIGNDSLNAEMTIKDPYNRWGEKLQLRIEFEKAYSAKDKPKNGIQVHFGHKTMTGYNGKPFDYFVSQDTKHWFKTVRDALEYYDIDPVTLGVPKKK